MTIRFDGQVALVTGGGRGMGREHCLLLARRGAKIVVNDLGVTMDGAAGSENPAQQVVDEIRAEGGEAVPNCDDVGAVDGPAAMVRTAIEQYGRIDIVVHNAAIVTFAPFGELTYEQYRALLSVHLDGGFLLAKEAWPHMVRQNHGRFVFITSQVAMSGLPNLAHYVVAKTGITGLARALAMEGEAVGIRANALGVTALTRMMTGFFEKDPADGRPAPSHMASSNEDWFRRHMRPELTSPVVAWLASRECDANGAILDTAAGYTVHQHLATTRGFYDPDLTPESVHEHRAEIFDREGANFFNGSAAMGDWRKQQIEAQTA